MRPRIGITLELSIRGERKLNFLDLAYAESVAMAGGTGVHFPSLPSAEAIASAVAAADGFVFTGGADIHPAYYGGEMTGRLILSPDQRTEFDLRLFRAALQAKRPVLAICHGMQIMNVALGGTLHQDIVGQVPDAGAHGRGKNPARHKVRVEPGSRLAEVLAGITEIEVSSLHHQAVNNLGGNLRVSAWSLDGLVEAIELPGNSRVISVQWHPEMDPQSEASRRIFRALIEMASSHTIL